MVLIEGDGEGGLLVYFIIGRCYERHCGGELALLGILVDVEIVIIMGNGAGGARCWCNVFIFGSSCSMDG